MVDFLILTSDPDQYRAIESKFSSKSLVAVKADDREFTVTELHSLESEGRGSERKVILAQLSKQSRAKVAVEMLSFLTALKPKVIILVGLAAGIKGKVNLGDIVISSRISELTAISVGKGRYEINDYSNISEPMWSVCKRLDEELEGPFHRKKAAGLRPPTLRFGSTLCTDYLGDLPDLKKVYRMNSSIAAIDMESAGIAAAVEAVPRRMDFLAVFCIADFAERSKVDFDRSEARDKAATFGAALVKAASSRENFVFVD